MLTNEQIAAADGATLRHLCQRIMDEMVRRDRLIGAKQVIEAVARAAGIPMNALTGPRNTELNALARQCAYFLAREATGLSMSEIGRAFGGRHHSTVIYGIRATDRRLREGHRETMRIIGDARDFLFDRLEPRRVA